MSNGISIIPDLSKLPYTANNILFSELQSRFSREVWNIIDKRNTYILRYSKSNIESNNQFVITFAINFVYYANYGNYTCSG